MGDVVVFPEQFSFDVRVQKSNPRRRLTIKNMGIMACKISISMPESDSFIVTDAKGKMLGGKTTINMIPDSSYCLFIQKKSTVGIVPEDSLVISGGKKTYNVALKPAVSLVSMEELESVASRQDIGSARSLESPNIDFTRDDFETQSIRDEPEPVKKPKQSRLPAPSRPRSTKSSEPKHTSKPAKPDPAPVEFNEDDFQPMKCAKIEPVKEDFEFTASDFQPTPEEPVFTEEEEPEPPSLPPPQIIESPPVKESGIPRRHADLPLEADVLERSLHVKFSFKDDDFVAKAATKKREVKWYDEDAFSDLQEPDFSFELMMTGDLDDPVFCMDGDYYDSSGRLLTVQQGKGQVIYVTEDGYEPEC